MLLLAASVMLLRPPHNDTKLSPRPRILKERKRWCRFPCKLNVKWKFPPVSMDQRNDPTRVRYDFGQANPQMGGMTISGNARRTAWIFAWIHMKELTMESVVARFLGIG